MNYRGDSRRKLQKQRKIVIHILERHDTNLKKRIYLQKEYDIWTNSSTLNFHQLKSRE